MREKLIELLCKAHGMATDASLFEDASYAQQLEAEADHLIANGVTIPVRCKECKNRDDITGECKHPKAVGWDVLMPEDDDFCSYGEKREV